MALDDDFLNKLIKTFKVELDEKLQIITDGLLALERSDLDEQHGAKIIEEIFRAAHNIKGAARGIGVNAVGEIAHRIESLFSAIRDKSKVISAELISLCLHAVDGMHSAMTSFCEKKSLDFNLNDLLDELQSDTPNKQFIASSYNIKPVQDNQGSLETQEYETMRVSLQQIDHISVLLEDLQANKITIEDHYSELVKLTDQTSHEHHSAIEHTDLLLEINYSLNKIRKDMNISINEYNTILNLLQEEVRKLRLIPASSVLRNITRSIRDLAIEFGKQIEFEVTGDGIKMDKMILEGLKDPLTHLIRNAVDHGIESPELRKQNGKSEVGTIRIDLIDEGDQIFFNISDDGAGIDHKTIANIALKNHVVPKAELENMHTNEILDLIFRPGFTTKEIITDISGRGVGLDVVKTNLMNIKGDVSVTTEPGKNTTFQLQVPLTLSSDRGLIIQSGGQQFIIPISTVEHVMMLHPNEVIEVESSQVILYDEQPVPLRILSDLLKLERSENSLPKTLPIIVLKKGKDSVALLVENIIGEREIVIKPLSPPLINVAYVTGGSLAGNGQVIVVLNANDVIHRAMHSDIKNRIASPIATLSGESQHHILLVDDSITTRTLEKNILENNNYKVTVAVDGKEAWDLLLKHRYSLLITDIEMPNMNGIELTERVKQHDKLHELPVIIVTSLGSESQKKQGIEAGASAYIAKHHFESKELLEIVAQLI